MNTKVKVKADAAGNVVVTSSNNPLYGHIRVVQERLIVDDRGFARLKTVSALIPGLKKDLKNFGWKAEQELDGTIIIKEQLEPFNPKEPERDYKIAGRTNIPCCIDGQPIYRKAFYNTNPNAQDVFIYDEFGNVVTHNNTDDIRAAYLELAEQDSAKQSQEQDLNIM